MNSPLRVLIVEDREEDAALLIRHLRAAGFDLHGERVDSASAMTAALDSQAWDVVVADYNMPRFSIPAALAMLRERKLDLPFILVSGGIGEDTAAAAMKTGAHDYIMKDKLTRLVPAIERELREAESRRIRRRAEERIAYLAYHDPLTGLPNRNRLEELITIEIAGGKPFALLFLELNRFREIVNTLGHGIGDQLLEQVAKMLGNNLEASLAARLDGERFAVLLPSASRAKAVALGCRLRDAMVQGIPVDGFNLDVDAGIGIALAHEPGLSVADLIRRADVAVVAARGHDDPRIYDAGDDPYSQRRLLLSNELRKAIEANQLFIVFQPKVDLKSLRAVGVEALVRWRHPTLGMIPPDEFIPVAERTGLIGALTLRVLNSALLHLEQWTSSGFDLSVAVNLSGRNVHDAHLPDRVAALLAERHAPSNRLEFELTESQIMQDPARARLNLLALKAMGVKTSIDDFGTGYSSLDYLRKLSVDTLKIDKSFVSPGLEAEDDSAIVKAAIDLGHNLGLNVVAEGVENRGTLDRLTALGCDAAQGYFFARPMSNADLREWLISSQWSSLQRPARL